MIFVYYMVGVYFMVVVQIQDRKFNPVKIFLWPYCLLLFVRNIIKNKQY